MFVFFFTPYLNRTVIPGKVIDDFPVEVKDNFPVDVVTAHLIS